MICALNGKAASLLQVELELEQPPIIQTVADGVAVNVPRSDRRSFRSTECGTATFQHRVYTLVMAAR